MNHRNNDETFKNHSFQILKRPKSVSSLSSPKCSSSASSTAGSVGKGSQDVRSRTGNSPDIPPSAVVQCPQKSTVQGFIYFCVVFCFLKKRYEIYFQILTNHIFFFHKLIIFCQPQNQDFQPMKIL